MVDVASSVHSPVSDERIATTSLADKEPIDNSLSSTIMEDARPISSTDITTSSVEVISLRKTDGGFGINIIGGTDSQHFPEENGIFISHIKPGGAADICGKLVPGDEIIALNNVSITGRTHDEVVNMFANSDEFATLVVDHAAEHRILKNDETTTIMGSITGAKGSSRGSTTTVSNLFQGPRTCSPSVTFPNEDNSAHVNGSTMKESNNSLDSDVGSSSNQTRAISLYSSHLHATSSFGSIKADADSTGWPNRSERDDDEMSTVTDASSHYFNDDIPPTPKRPYSILDGESPYAGIIYGLVGTAVICVVGYLVVKRFTRRGHTH